MTFLQATLEQGEAVLKFPYDDALRRLLRTIPGRRWDPGERAWIVPLDPERAQAVALLLENLPRRTAVSEPLVRALARQRGRRAHDECVLDVARPDESWWLTFATDRAPTLVAALLEHPDCARAAHDRSRPDSARRGGGSLGGRLARQCRTPASERRCRSRAHRGRARAVLAHGWRRTLGGERAARGGARRDGLRRGTAPGPSQTAVGVDRGRARPARARPGRAIGSAHRGEPKRRLRHSRRRA